MWLMSVDFTASGRPVVPPPASQARPPRPEVCVVERRHLLRRLTRSVEGAPLTLVCAPAGSGKTVLVADWAERRASTRPVAWLTLTERDAQPGVFWAHLQLALALVGALAVDALRPMFPDAGDVDDLSTELLGLAVPVVLVIDGLDRLRGRDVYRPLARLLDNTGERLRVVMISRTDPPLPLHRYRVENRLAEIRADDLALTRTEVGEVLVQHGLRPSKDVTLDLLRRTEGWAAGVRLGALRLGSAGDDTPLDGFATEYLRAEILSGLTPVEREILGVTSVLDELPRGLAPTVTGRPDADELVRHMSSGNTFVLPVPGRAQVFRVHPLVRQLLHDDHERTAPGFASVAHRRAAAWFEAQGQLVPAVRHATAAGDWEHAATLVVQGEGLGDVLLRTTRGSALVEHLVGLPAYDTADVRLVRAAIALGHGELDRATAELAHGTAAARDDRRTLAVAVLRTALHDAAGNPDETLAAASEARARLTASAEGSDGSETLRAAVVSAEGAARLRVGDLDTASTALSEALPAASGADGLLRLRCLAELALAEACRGHLFRALRLADAAEREASEQDVPSAARPAAGELARAWVALEQQDLAQAQRSLDHGTRLGRGEAQPWTAMTTLLRARLMRDRGDGTGARRLLERSERATGWLRDHLDAEAVALGIGTSTSRPPTTTAHQVHTLLDRADARCRAGRVGSAKTDVARALTMAQTERLRRPFAHTSPRIRALVRTDASLYAKAGWLRPEQLGGAAGPSPAPRAADPVREALSERELEVLQHLSALLTTDEIAAEMFISVNTVRTHVRKVLQKLSVSRRNDAVRRGRELGLV
jgi:LuxR family transcriptional regulator, maltose regulon positive regulatory protein